MVKVNKNITKEASRFYGQVKYDGELKQVTTELQEVLNGIQNTATFRQMMHLEHISFEEKEALLNNTVQHLSQSTKEYLIPYLSLEGSVHLIEAIEAFLDIYDANKLEMTSAVPLTQQQMDRISEAFQKKTHKEYDSVVNTVDPSVIAGVRLKTKEYLLDGTVLHKLEQFKKQVSQTGLKR